MNLARIAAIVVAAALMLLAPWTEFGAVCIMYIAPATLGGMVSQLTLKSRHIHSFALATSLVSTIGGLRLFSEGLSEGSFYFDGEWDLVITGIVLQAVVAGSFWCLDRTSRKLHELATVPG